MIYSRRYNDYLLPLIPLALFFGGWELAAHFGLINTHLFPAPTKILAGLKTLALKESEGHSLLLLHCLVTLKRLLIAASLGALAGVLFGLLMGINTATYSFMDPLITLLVSIPGIAMAPVFIVWLGFGDLTIVVVGAIATFFPVVYNTATGLRSMDKQLIRAARIMGASQWATFTQVYIPWASVFLFTGLKFGLARCWRTVVAVEFIAAASWGMGYMIWDASEYLRADLVYGGILLLALSFSAIEKCLIYPLEKATVEKWGMLKK